MQSINIHLASIKEKPLIENFLGNYLAELGVKKSYKYLPLYWSNPSSRFAYLIQNNDDSIGFALVRRTTMFEMAEFYLTPEFRRMGVGREAVKQLFEAHPGKWEISVNYRNTKGCKFWSSILQISVAKLPIKFLSKDRIIYKLNILDTEKFH